MFETATLASAATGKRLWATAAGMSAQAALVACAVLTPMIWPSTLQRAFLVTGIVAPTAPPGKPVDTPRVQPAKPASGPVKPWQGFVAPTTIPDHVVQIVDEEPIQHAYADAAPCNTCVPGGIPGAPTGGGNDSLLTRLIGSVPTAPVVHAAERSDPPKPVAQPAKPPRVTSVEMAKPIYRVDPVYPRIAIDAHISGTVELLGVLGVDGRIHELRVIKGHPLLIAAAMDAVKQWIYRPTILNGQPVEVSAPIQVNFILHR